MASDDSLVEDLDKQKPTGFNPWAFLRAVTAFVPRRRRTAAWTPRRAELRGRRREWCRMLLPFAPRLGRRRLITPAPDAPSPTARRSGPRARCRARRRVR